MASRLQRVKNSIFPVAGPIYAAAPMQKVRMDFAGRGPSPPYSQDSEKNFSRPVSAEVSTEAEISTAKKANAFDNITRAAGSSSVFFGMLAILVAWLIWGIVSGTTDTWQITMQNASSIQVYISDILLIRQQQNATRGLMTTLAELQSRNQTCERLLRRIPDCQWMETHKEGPKQLTLNGRSVEDEVEESLFMASGRPSRMQYIWTKSCHFMARTLGSLYAYIFYWIGVLAWIGIGPLFQFSDVWQLYINTATAVALTFTSVFLQNIQQQQEDTLEACLAYALKIDADIEHRLRELIDDQKPNPIFQIANPKLNIAERAIEGFAHIMGSLVGVIMTVVVFIVWIAVGPVLQFGDNWFLIIGTFTGLVGFVDGFVLRNLYTREERSVKQQFKAVSASDQKLLDLLNVPLTVPVPKKRSLAARISIKAGDALGTATASIGSVLVVVLLLVIATAMRWSTTGQLLCNTPTMIIEGFVLLVLIQAHNISNEERGMEFNGVLKRRLLLDSYVHTLDGPEYF